MVLFHKVFEGFSMDTDLLGGLGDIPIVGLESSGEVVAFEAIDKLLFGEFERNVEIDGKLLGGGGGFLSEESARRRGKKGSVDLWAFGEDHGAFDVVFEFADVSGPRVAFEFFHGVMGDDVAGGVFALVPEEEVDKEGDIFDPVAERWKLDVDHGESVVEVLAEGTFLHHLFEGAVGSSDDPNVDLGGVVAAKGFDFAGFEDTKEFGLEVEREFTEFVEKKGTALGGDKGTRSALDGSGEGTFDVTEEFGFDEFAGDGRAVEDHEGLGSAGRVVVDGAGHEFFSGARLAGDQDGCVGRRDALKDAKDFFHFETLAVKFAIAVAFREIDIDGFASEIEAEGGTAEADPGARAEEGRTDAEGFDVGSVFAFEVFEE